MLLAWDLFHQRCYDNPELSWEMSPWCLRAPWVWISPERPMRAGRRHQSLIPRAVVWEPRWVPVLGQAGLMWLG